MIVPPPRQRRGEHRDLPLATDGVSVGAIDPPAGAEPLEWILLSNEPTTPWEQARERIGW